MYTVDYFINKFQAIPENKWITKMWHTVEDKTICCAGGHCGMGILAFDVPEYVALDELFKTYLNEGVTQINDGRDYIEFIKRGSKYSDIPTPKQRILAALYDVKKLQTPEYQDITSSIASEFVESPESTDVVKTIVNA